MTVIRNKRLKAVVALVLIFMIVVSIMPNGLFRNTAKVEAASLPSTYDAGVVLYDYYTDNEINGGGFNSSGMNGFQDPYTKFNAAISGSTVNDGVTTIYFNNPNNWYNVYAHVYAKDGESTSWKSAEELMSYNSSGVYVTGRINTGSAANATYKYSKSFDLRNKVKNSTDAILYVMFVGTDAGGGELGRSVVYPISANYTNYCFWGTVDGSEKQETVKRTVNLSTQGSSAYATPLYFGDLWEGNSGNNYVNDSKPGYNNFYWNANIAQRNDYTSTVRGLAATDLGSGEVINFKSGNKAMPYFDGGWLTSKGVGTSYSGLKLTFNREKDASGNYTSYYYYNSENKDINGNSYNQAVYLNGGALESGNAVRNNSTSDSTKTYGFFPFDNSNSTTNGNDPALNMAFGMKLSIDFKLPAATSPSLAKDAEGNDIIFYFTGDDDMWVYIDDKLTLDLGGAHSSASGEINFTQQTVTLYKSIDFNANPNTVNSGEGNTISSDVTYTFAQLGLNGLVYDGTTPHRIRCFYMERGMIESNLMIRFNIPTLSNDNTLKIREITDFDNAGINAGLKSYTKQAADGDVFNYTVSNKGTVNDDVSDSGILTPTYDYYERKNTDAKVEQDALLTGQELSNILYFDKSAVPGWTSSTRYLKAWVWRGAKDGTGYEGQIYSPTSQNGNIYTFSSIPADANNVIFMRCKTNLADGSGWPGSPGSTNVANALPTVSFVSGDVIGPTSTSDYNAGGWLRNELYSTNNFTPGTTNNSGTPVANVNYNWNDDYASKLAKDQEDDEIDGMTGTTDNTGSFRLMYGTSSVESSAEFIGQFAKAVSGTKVSEMTVVQDNTLRKADRTDSENVRETFASNNGRNVSTYYTTTVKVIDKLGNDITPSGATTSTVYDYKNADSVASSESIQITETFTNTPRVGALKFKKTLDPGDNVTETFTFKLALTNVFGVSGVNVSGDYNNITISGATWVGSDGTFTVNNGVDVTIEGIPVGTSFSITEQNNGTTNYEPKSGASGPFTGTITEGTVSTTSHSGEIKNTRRVGDLVLNKELSGVYSDADNNQSFTFSVTLNAPTGVDFSNYTIKQDGTTITPASGTAFDVSVSKSTPVTLTGIPYGTTYTVTEPNVPDDSWQYVSGAVTAGDGLSISDATQSVTITNERKFGSLNLQKVIGGSAAAAAYGGEEFDYSVTLNYPAGTDTSKFTVTNNGTALSPQPTSTRAFTVKVSANTPVALAGIPYGTTYSVTEPRKTGWKNTASSNTNGNVNNTTPAPTASFTNTPDLVDIYISKSWAGLDEGTQISIEAGTVTFKVERSSDSGATWETVTTDFYGNAVTFRVVPTLPVNANSEGETVASTSSFTGLPKYDGSGNLYTYKITECNTDGTPLGDSDMYGGNYVVTYTPREVALAAGSTRANFAVVNTKQVDIVMPTTGVIPEGADFLLIGISIMATAMIALLVYKRKAIFASILIQGRYLKK